MDLTKWANPAPKDLWEAFDGLRGEMDRALDIFRVPDVAGIFDQTTTPAIDVVETADEYVVMADIPGVDKRDLNVTVTGSILAIQGDKRDEHKSEKRKVFRKETWVGSFKRTINLPEQVDANKIGAELKDGVLTVRIGKREEAKTKMIAVQAD
jgi:HSP20 family protein